MRSVRRLPYEGVALALALALLSSCTDSSSDVSPETGQFSIGGLRVRRAPPRG